MRQIAAFPARQFGGLGEFALTGLGAGILLICRRAQFIKWL
jgi:hypothetical protein